LDANAIYRADVNSPSLTPDEIRAAAGAHHELGPDYQPAVIESFLEKVGREIDARVDARLAAGQVGQPGPFAGPGQYPPPMPYPQPVQHGQPGQYGQPAHFAPPPPPARQSRERTAFALAVVSMAFGIPLTAIAVAAGPNPVGLGGVFVIWLAIAVINIAYSRQAKPPDERR
jgi:hypothetical protein